MDGTIATPLGVVFKILGHPSFSILAVPVALEAKPRAILFIGLGYGFHSLMNFIVEALPDGVVRDAVYVGVLLLILVLDLLLMSRWYPSIPAKLRRVSRRTAGH